MELESPSIAAVKNEILDHQQQVRLPEQSNIAGKL
jgi:hypothetical protein